MCHYVYFVYVMRLTPFEFEDVKRLNSHIFMNFFGCNDIGRYGKIWTLIFNEGERR